MVCLILRGSRMNRMTNVKRKHGKKKGLKKGQNVWWAKQYRYSDGCFMSFKEAQRLVKDYKEVVGL